MSKLLQMVVVHTKTHGLGGRELSYKYGIWEIKRQKQRFTTPAYSEPVPSSLHHTL